MNRNGIIKKIGIFLLLFMLVISSVSAVIMDPSVNYVATNFTLNSRSSINVDYINLSSYWINLGNYGNITFASNISSSNSIIERDGSCGSNCKYTTVVTVDVYAPSTWTARVYFRYYDNGSMLDRNKTITTYTQFNSTHRRYSDTYNPRNTIPASRMGYFDLNCYVYAYNTTLTYRGYRVFENFTEVVDVSPPYGHTGEFNTTWQSINFTWVQGNSSDSTVIVRNNNSYPTCPSSGYIVQNSSTTFYNVSSVDTTRYYSAFSYNSSTNCFSEALYLLWGGLAINVYNESNPSQGIGFDIEISDEDGIDTYTAMDQTNTFYIDFNDIPYGDDTVIVISNSSYRTRTYIYDLAISNFYNYTFYLPPFETPGAGGGGGDANTTLLCLISVIDVINQPVPNANVTIKRYINTTDSYQTVSRLLTDGNGQISIWLVPNQLYLFDITKEGYVQSGSKYWIPNELLYTKTFMLNFISPIFDNETSINDVITFDGWVYSNGTMRINYTDSSENTINTYIVIWRYNHTTHVTDTVVLTDSRSGDNEFTVSTSVNTSHTYYGVCYLNHSSFGYVVLFWIDEHPTAPGATSTTGITSITNFNTMLNNVLGNNPFGWSNIFGLFILLGCLFAFGQRNAGLGLIMGGFVVLFMNFIVGLEIFAAGIPIFYIVSGVIVQWNNHRREGSFV